MAGLKEKDLPSEDDIDPPASADTGVDASSTLSESQHTHVHK